MSKSNTELREELRTILQTGATTYDATKGQVYFSADTHLDQIMQLVEQEVNKSEINGLLQARTIVVENNLQYGDDEESTVTQAIDDRIKALKQLEGGK